MGYDAGRTEEKDVKKMSVLAGAEVNAYRILKKGSSQDEVIQATLATDFPLGISGAGSLENAETYDDGDAIDVAYSGIRQLEMSGTGNQDGRVTATTGGKGIAHTTADGVYIIGYAMQSWTDGQIIPVLIDRCYIGDYAQT